MAIVYHLLPSKWGLAALQDQRVKLSTYDDLNDPFELLASSLEDRLIRDTFLDFKKDIATQTALLCCSSSWRSTLLWSHYADKHKGVALELEVDDKLCCAIKYSRARSPIDRKFMDAMMKSESSGLGNFLTTTKSLDWSYEKEIRLFFRIGHIRKIVKPLFFGFNEHVRLAGIVLGPLCTLSLSAIAEAVPPGCSVKVSRSRLAFRSFDVVLDRSFKARAIDGKAT